MQKKSVKEKSIPHQKGRGSTHRDLCGVLQLKAMGVGVAFLQGELGAGHSNRYVFNGRIKCGVCGASFVSRKKRRKDGSSNRHWSFHGPNKSAVGPNIVRYGS